MFINNLEQKIEADRAELENVSQIIKTPLGKEHIKNVELVKAIRKESETTNKTLVELPLKDNETIGRKYYYHTGKAFRPLANPSMKAHSAYGGYFLMEEIISGQKYIMKINFGDELTSAVEIGNGETRIGEIQGEEGQ